MALGGRDIESDGNAACAHERDERGWPEHARFRLHMQLLGTIRHPVVRARWERLTGRGSLTRYELVCSGRGATEAEALAALRDNLRELRRRRALHRPMGAWSVGMEVSYAQ